MRRTIAACMACMALATPVAAASLLGDWTCQDKDKDGEAISLVTFKKNGIMLADMQITYNVPNLDVRAWAKYRGRFTLSKEGILEDTPIRARIMSFTADGEDISRGKQARQLRAYLMQDDSVQGKITKLTEQDLVIRAAGRDIVCRRSKPNLDS